MDRKRICLCEDCDELAKSRGLCLAHYCGARYRVLTGKTTWRKLERQGLAIPKGKSKASDFDKALSKSK